MTASGPAKQVIQQWGCPDTDIDELLTATDVRLRPVVLRLELASLVYGFSRSDLYRRSKNGEITLLKMNRHTVVLVAEMDRLIAGLPRLHPAKAPQ